MLSILGAGIYSVLHLFNLDFRTDLALLYRLLTFFLVVVPSLLCIYFLHLYLSAYQVSKETRVWVYLGSVFGTLILPYAMVLQNHNIAAALLLGSYIFLENPMKVKTERALLLSGFLLGLAISMDLNVLFFGLTFSVLGVWWYWKKNIPSVLLFFLMVSLPVLFTWYLFWAISGRWAPFVVQAEGYFYPGSPVPKINSFGGYDSLPLKSYLIYLWHSLLGYRGVFSHSAFLVLGFWGLVLAARKSSQWLPPALAIISAILMLWGVLTIKSPITFGGSNFAFRYMVIWMPLVGLFAFKMWEFYGVKVWMKALILVSILTSGMGMFSPSLIHSFNSIELMDFDFLLARDLRINPYMQYEKIFAPYAEEIQKLKTHLDSASLLKLAFIYFQGGRAVEALGYLDLVREESDRECYKGVLFSKRALNLADLMKRHVDRCPKEQWAKLSKEMNLEMQ